MSFLTKRYTDEIYFEALKQQMRTLRRAFPNTVVIQYTNFPSKLLTQFTDFEKEIGVGMGGPDVYPRKNVLFNPERGVYRFYAKLAGTVPLGAAVQRADYAEADMKRNALRGGHTKMDGEPITIKPEDEIPIPVREHLRLAQGTLRLNYMFWAASNPRHFDNVKKLRAEPDLASDPAGGLETKLPPKAFVR